MHIEDDSADLTIREDHNHACPQPSSPIGLHAQISATLPEKDDDPTSTDLNMQRLTDFFDLGPFNGYQGDFGELFDIDPANLDLFGWSGNSMPDTTEATRL